MYLYFRRQFDNVKRVYKAVEELQGSVIQNICNIFLISEDLAKYLILPFIILDNNNNNRVLLGSTELLFS